jgi:hypothetical protein
MARIFLAVSYAGVCVAGRADSRGALQFFDDRSDIIHPRRRLRKIAYGRRSLDISPPLYDGSFGTIRYTASSPRELHIAVKFNF